MSGSPSVASSGRSIGLTWKGWRFSRSAFIHPFTMRESPYIRSLPHQMPWVLGVAVAMAVMGPFGIYERMGIGWRFVYFLAVGALNWLQVIVLAAWFGTQEPVVRWPVTVRMALAGFLATIPGTAEIMLINSWISWPIPWRFAPMVYAQNAFITVTIAVLVGLIIERRLHAAADLERARVAALPPAARTVEAAAPAPLDFFRRVPPALGRDLLALEMEDHYLRIHTVLGSDLILLRLRDALAELGPARGRQVHRSWWVAESAVASVERSNGRLRLVLRNGLRVPVSKSFREQVKDAGWLE